MRILIAASMVGTVLVAVPASQSNAPATSSPTTLERPFPSGGRIRMDLSAGQYRIKGVVDGRIRVDWRVREADRQRTGIAKVDVRGSDGTITTDGPNKDFRVDIQVPARSDLHVRLTAGEIAIEGIEGNKDVKLHAGEVDIDVGRAEDYGRVGASVWAGEIRANPYHITKGGLFRSVDWRGTGPYNLQAHLKAGEVRLHSRAAIAK